MSIESLISQVDPYMAGKIAAGIVGGGFACAGVGHVVEKAGVEIKNCAGNGQSMTSLALRKLGGGVEGCGRGLFYTGKYTAYTVVVPAYIATYEFPKWAILKAIPKAYSLANRLVLKPVFSSAQWVASQVAKIASVLFDNLIFPTMKLLLWKPLSFLASRSLKLLTAVCEGVLFPIVDAIENLVIICLIKPLFRLTVWTCKRVVETIQIVDRYLFSPILQITKKIGKIALEILVTPIFNSLRFVTEKCVLPVVSTVIRVVNRCILMPIVYAIKWTYQDLISPVALAARAVMDFAHRYFIELPLRHMSQYILKPVIHLITASAKLICQKLLAPIYEIMARTLYVLSKSIKSVFDCMLQISSVMQSLYR